VTVDLPCGWREVYWWAGVDLPGEQLDQIEGGGGSGGEPSHPSPSSRS
jgi:hypothetical protein